MGLHLPDSEWPNQYTLNFARGMRGQVNPRSTAQIRPASVFPGGMGPAGLDPASGPKWIGRDHLPAQRSTPAGTGPRAGPRPGRTRPRGLSRRLQVVVRAPGRLRA